METNQTKKGESKNALLAPKTTEQEILLHLIENGKVSIFDFPYLSGFRTRISNLKKKGVEIESELIKGVNKYGNKYLFALHSIIDKNTAVSIYENLTHLNRK